jgi:hypothetical protein
VGAGGHGPQDCDDAGDRLGSRRHAHRRRRRTPRSWTQLPQAVSNSALPRASRLCPQADRLLGRAPDAETVARSRGLERRPAAVRLSGRFNAGSSFGRSEGGRTGRCGRRYGLHPGAGGRFHCVRRTITAHPERGLAGSGLLLHQLIVCLYRRRVLNGFLPQDGPHPTRCGLSCVMGR